MERTLAKLRQAGLVEGIRGTGGGYYLSKPAHQITLAEIVAAAESPEPHAQWLDMPAKTVEQVITQEIWREMDNKLHGLLSSVTLGSLLKIEHKRVDYKPSLTARLIAKMFPPRLPEPATGMAY
jgi:Rrf2 family iron-sulfur cluster assembly transcriptional regulator